MWYETKRLYLWTLLHETRTVYIIKYIFSKRLRYSSNISNKDKSLIIFLHNYTILMIRLMSFMICLKTYMIQFQGGLNPNLNKLFGFD